MSAPETEVDEIALDGQGRLYTQAPLAASAGRVIAASGLSPLMAVGTTELDVLSRFAIGYQKIGWFPRLGAVPGGTDAIKGYWEVKIRAPEAKSETAEQARAHWFGAGHSTDTLVRVASDDESIEMLRFALGATTPEHSGVVKVYDDGFGAIIATRNGMAYELPAECSSSPTAEDCVEEIAEMEGYRALLPWSTLAGAAVTVGNAPLRLPAVFTYLPGLTGIEATYATWIASNPGAVQTALASSTFRPTL